MADLTDLIETFGIAACTGAAGVPGGLPLVPHDRAAQAENERVVFTATAGAKELEGPECYPVSLLVEYHTVNRDPSETNPIWAAIWEAIKPSNILWGYPYAVENLDPLIYISEEGGDDRSDTKNVRKKSRTLNFKALQALTP